MKYIIEVQKICDLSDIENQGKFEHLGYINKICNYMKDIKKYFKLYNPHLSFRGSRRRTYLTNVDINTGCRYLIREYKNEKLTLYF
jgi:hypothetical protein